MCAREAGADGSLECVHGYLPEQIEAVLATQDGMPECDVLEWPELFDSSNMEPASWVQLAKDVERLYWDYDGFGNAMKAGSNQFGGLACCPNC